jgi:hypothetical protein
MNKDCKILSCGYVSYPILPKTDSFLPILVKGQPFLILTRGPGRIAILRESAWRPPGITDDLDHFFGSLSNQEDHQKVLTIHVCLFFGDWLSRFLY